MSRVNVFAEVSNDTRRVSIGGRGSNDATTAWLNTDNAEGTVAIRVRAEVCGEGLRSKERRRKDGDKRRSYFTVELPERDESGAPGCSVNVAVGNQSLKALAQIGCALVALKGACHDAKGEPEQAAKCFTFTAETLADLKADAEKALPYTVNLPGGFTLAEATAAIRFVREFFANDTAKNGN